MLWNETLASKCLGNNLNLLTPAILSTLLGANNWNWTREKVLWSPQVYYTDFLSNLHSSLSSDLRNPHIFLSNINKYILGRLKYRFKNIVIKIQGNLPKAYHLGNGSSGSPPLRADVLSYVSPFHKSRLTRAKYFCLEGLVFGRLFDFFFPLEHMIKQFINAKMCGWPSFHHLT